MLISKLVSVQVRTHSFTHEDISPPFWFCLRTIKSQKETDCLVLKYLNYDQNSSSFIALDSYMCLFFIIPHHQLQVLYCQVIQSYCNSMTAISFIQSYQYYIYYMYVDISTFRQTWWQTCCYWTTWTACIYSGGWKGRMDGWKSRSLYHPPSFSVVSLSSLFSFFSFSPSFPYSLSHFPLYFSVSFF